MNSIDGAQPVLSRRTETVTPSAHRSREHTQKEKTKCSLSTRLALPTRLSLFVVAADCLQASPPGMVKVKPSPPDTQHNEIGKQK